jgi:hypothetical protein
MYFDDPDFAVVQMTKLNTTNENYLSISHIEFRHNLYKGLKDTWTDFIYDTM